MAAYQDFSVPPDWDAERTYTEIATLLAGGTYSVEVLRNGGSVILRAWLSRHCDPATHQRV